MKKVFFISMLFLLTALMTTGLYAQNPINITQDKECVSVFQNIKTICDNDNGKLWGINLYAPILCINKSRNIWSNQKDPQGLLNEHDGYFTGTYPETKNVANSTTEAFGQKWATIMLPFPPDSIELITLVCHEMFHYWQDTLNLVPSKIDYNNTHMDKKDARILLKLEWTALYSACKANDIFSRKEAISNGLTFRKLRHKIFNEFYNDETAFEIHEGLAQYTGRKLATQSDSLYIEFLNKDFESNINKNDYVRSFAYFSGEILGFLLDESKTNWRKQINENSDLGVILQQAYQIKLPSNLEKQYESIKNKYGYKDIYYFEEKRDLIKSQEKENLRKIFSKNIKELPLKNVNISFDPNSVVPIEDIGNAYKNARVIDNWGILETKDNGVIVITNDWKTIILPYADRIEIKENIEETEYWKLTTK